MKSVIITGSTGMVGKGVLLECLEEPSIDKVLVINRSKIDLSHPKLKEILLKDFTKISDVQDELYGYDACFYCMGISSLGLSEEEFSHITFTITKAFADVLFDCNPEMFFNYVSGTGTDSSESGRIMWARVKGKTENYILEKGFSKAYAFRPGFIIPEKGIRSRTKWYDYTYRIIRPIFPLLKKLKSITTTTKIGKAMIATLTVNQYTTHLENRDINALVLE